MPGCYPTNKYEALVVDDGNGNPLSTYDNYRMMTHTNFDLPCTGISVDPIGDTAELKQGYVSGNNFYCGRKLVNKCGDGFYENVYGDCIALNKFPLSGDTTQMPCSDYNDARCRGTCQNFDIFDNSPTIIVEPSYNFIRGDSTCGMCGDGIVDPGEMCDTGEFEKTIDIDWYSCKTGCTFDIVNAVTDITDHTGFNLHDFCTSDGNNYIFTNRKRSFTTYMPVGFTLTDMKNLGSQIRFFLRSFIRKGDAWLYYKLSTVTLDNFYAYATITDYTTAMTPVEENSASFSIIRALINYDVGRTGAAGFVFYYDANEADEANRYKIAIVMTADDGDVIQFDSTSSLYPEYEGEFWLKKNDKVCLCGNGYIDDGEECDTIVDAFTLNGVPKPNPYCTPECKAVRGLSCPVKRKQSTQTILPEGEERMPYETLPSSLNKFEENMQQTTTNCAYLSDDIWSPTSGVKLGYRVSQDPYELTYSGSSFKVRKIYPTFDVTGTPCVSSDGNGNNVQDDRFRTGTLHTDGTTCIPRYTCKPGYPPDDYGRCAKENSQPYENGIFNDGETVCDNAWEGCTCILGEGPPVCEFKSGYTCDGVNGCVLKCGDGMKDDDEDCDMGVYNGGLCTYECKIRDTGTEFDTGIMCGYLAAAPATANANSPDNWCLQCGGSTTPEIKSFGTSETVANTICNFGTAASEACSDICTINTEYQCPSSHTCAHSPSPPPTAESCGDGIVNTVNTVLEDCDLGVITGVVGGIFGCTSTCEYVTTGIICTTDTITNIPLLNYCHKTQPVCGDGNKDAGEACDDGNNIDNDECSNSCTLGECQDSLNIAGYGHSSTPDLRLNNMQEAKMFKTSENIPAKLYSVLQELAFVPDPTQIIIDFDPPIVNAPIGVKTIFCVKLFSETNTEEIYCLHGSNGGNNFYFNTGWADYNSFTGYRTFYVTYLTDQSITCPITTKCNTPDQECNLEDFNGVSGFGCTSTCERSATNIECTPDYCYSTEETCGNGIIGGTAGTGEQCDDGNDIDNDGCSECSERTCTQSPGVLGYSFKSRDDENLFRKSATNTVQDVYKIMQVLAIVPPSNIIDMTDKKDVLRFETLNFAYCIKVKHDNVDTVYCLHSTPDGNTVYFNDGWKTETYQEGTWEITYGIGPESTCGCVYDEGCYSDLVNNEIPMCGLGVYASYPPHVDFTCEERKCVRKDMCEQIPYTSTPPSGNGCSQLRSYAICERQPDGTYIDVCLYGETDGNCIFPPSGCGNTVKSGTEQCDDGNVINGDGCSSSCTLEPGWTCIEQPTFQFDECKATLCGDGIIAGDEQCDNNNDPNCIECQYPPFKTCFTHQSTTETPVHDSYTCVPSSCGDCVVNIEAGEECDRGPFNSDDYGDCDSNCRRRDRSAVLAVSYFQPDKTKCEFVTIPAKCYNGGEMSTPNAPALPTCTCAAGFYGADCSIPAAILLPDQHITDDGTTCEEGYYRSVFATQGVPDCSVKCSVADSCNNKGTCDTYGSCICESGYSGSSCSTPVVLAVGECHECLVCGDYEYVSNGCLFPSFELLSLAAARGRATPGNNKHIRFTCPPRIGDSSLLDGKIFDPECSLVAPTGPDFSRIVIDATAIGPLACTGIISGSHITTFGLVFSPPKSTPDASTTEGCLPSQLRYSVEGGLSIQSRLDKSESTNDVSIVRCSERLKTHMACENNICSVESLITMLLTKDVLISKSDDQCVRNAITLSNPGIIIGRTANGDPTLKCYDAILDTKSPLSIWGPNTYINYMLSIALGSSPTATDEDNFLTIKDIVFRDNDGTAIRATGVTGMDVSDNVFENPKGDSLALVEIFGHVNSVPAGSTFEFLRNKITFDPSITFTGNYDGTAFYFQDMVRSALSGTLPTDMPVDIRDNVIGKFGSPGQTFSYAIALNNVNNINDVTTAPFECKGISTTNEWKQADERCFAFANKYAHGRLQDIMRVTSQTSAPIGRTENTCKDFCIENAFLNTMDSTEYLASAVITAENTGIMGELKFTANLAIKTTIAKVIPVIDVYKYIPNSQAELTLHNIDSAQPSGNELTSCASRKMYNQPDPIRDNNAAWTLDTPALLGDSWEIINSNVAVGGLSSTTVENTYELSATINLDDLASCVDFTEVGTQTKFLMCSAFLTPSGPDDTTDFNTVHVGCTTIIISTVANGIVTTSIVSNGGIQLFNVRVLRSRFLLGGTVEYYFSTTIDSPNADPNTRRKLILDGGVTTSATFVPAATAQDEWYVIPDPDYDPALCVVGAGTNDECVQYWKISSNAGPGILSATSFIGTQNVFFKLSDGPASSTLVLDAALNIHLERTLSVTNSRIIGVHADMQVNENNAYRPAGATEVFTDYAYALVCIDDEDQNMNTVMEVKQATFCIVVDETAWTDYNPSNPTTTGCFDIASIQSTGDFYSSTDPAVGIPYETQIMNDVAFPEYCTRIKFSVKNWVGESTTVHLQFAVEVKVGGTIVTPPAPGQMHIASVRTSKTSTYQGMTQSFHTSMQPLRIHKNVNGTLSASVVSEAWYNAHTAKDTAAIRDSTGTSTFVDSSRHIRSATITLGCSGENIAAHVLSSKPKSAVVAKAISSPLQCIDKNKYDSITDSSTNTQWYYPKKPSAKSHGFHGHSESSWFGGIWSIVGLVVLLLVIVSAVGYVVYSRNRSGYQRLDSGVDVQHRQVSIPIQYAVTQGAFALDPSSFRDLHAPSAPQAQYPQRP